MTIEVPEGQHYRAVATTSTGASPQDHEGVSHLF